MLMCSCTNELSRARNSFDDFLAGGSRGNISGKITNGANIANIEQLIFLPAIDSETANFIGDLLRKIDGNFAGIMVKSTDSKDSSNTSYTADVSVNISGAIKFIMQSFINNIDLPVKNILNETLENYYPSSGVTAETFLEKLKEIDADATFNGAVALLDDYLSPIKINAKILINLLIPISYFYDESGSIIDGVTLYDDSYTTIIKSFGKMRFFTVYGVLFNDGDSVTKSEFDLLVDGISVFLNTPTHVVLADYINLTEAQLAILISNKDKVAAQVSNGNFNIIFYMNKQFKVVKIGITLNVTANISFMGLKIPFINISADLAVNYNEFN